MDATTKNFLLMDSLARELEEVDDRVQGRIVHPAKVILLVTIAGIFAKCQTWNDIADYGACKIDLLRRFIPDLEITPSHDTLRRFFSIINPKKLECLYRKWAQTMLPEKEQGRHIAIDGKRMRSATRNKSLLNSMVSSFSDMDKIHIVTAYDVTDNIALGQECVSRKSNEITADKSILEWLELRENDLVTLDALGTQKELARSIRQKKADYLFIVKDNHKRLRKTIEEVVNSNLAKGIKRKNDYAEHWDDKAHGYYIERICFSIEEKLYLGSLHNDWEDVRTIGMFKTIRINKNTGDKSELVQYFITSLGKDATRLLNYKRSHWEIENGLHRILDVEFNEDDSQKKLVSAMNYSVITKMVLAILKNNAVKLPLNRKRMLAGWNDNYMEELILQTINAFDF